MMKNLSEYFLCLYLKLMGLVRNEKGQTLIEYALIIVLIALVVWVLVQGTGKSVNSIFCEINSVMNSVPGN